MSQVPTDLNAQCGGKEQLASANQKRFPVPQTGRGIPKAAKKKPANGLLQPGPKPDGGTESIKRQWDIIWQQFHEWWSEHPTVSWPTQRNKVEELVELSLANSQFEGLDRITLIIDALSHEELLTLIVDGVNRLSVDSLGDLVVKLNDLLESRKMEGHHESNQS